MMKEDLHHRATVSFQKRSMTEMEIMQRDVKE